MLTGAVLLLGLLALALLVRTAEMTEHDLHVDELIRPWRTTALTGFFIALTSAASEVVGLGALVVGIAVLVVRRRRWDAVRLLAMAGSSWALALVVKDVVGRPRPPAALWALAPDPSGSFPSGHDTTACVLVLVVLTVVPGRARIGATVAALVFAAAVGVSRVYLGDHYPTDVLGSWLTVATGAVLALLVLDLPTVRRAVSRIVRDPRAVMLLQERDAA